MNNFGATTFRPQNFAVSSGPLPRIAPEERGTVLPPSELDRLENEVSLAWARWWDLFRAADVWTDPRVRRAMCAARLEYQDALFELAAACAALNSRELR